MKEHILVVDDDHKIASMLKRALSYEGYKVSVVHNGEDALLSLNEDTIDLIILDIMLPGLDGWATCTEIRAQFQIPIIMLTAKDEVEQRVKGLDLGADDYVVKPFALDELLARIRVHLRRRVPPLNEQKILAFSDIQLSLDSRDCMRGNHKIDLRGKEFELLEWFMRHPNKVLAKDQLLRHAWGHDFEGESNVVEVYIASLRSKLEEHGQVRLIHTIRGLGYILREES